MSSKAEGSASDQLIEELELKAKEADRQVLLFESLGDAGSVALSAPLTLGPNAPPEAINRGGVQGWNIYIYGAVSYTHLTLPTKA